MSTTFEAPVEIKAETRSHRISVRGEELLAKVRELIHQGNVRRIIVINEEGQTLLEIPLTAGVIGAIVAPVLVAVGAIAALAQSYTLLIEARNPEASRTTPRGPTARAGKARRSPRAATR
jgi:hypothetical protein